MRNFNKDNNFNNRSSSHFQDDQPKKFGRRDRDSPRFGGRDSGHFERRDSERSFEKKMHQVICDKCGETCEVPFRPSEGKPVYCSNCFRKNDRQDSPRSNSAPSRNELDQINEKLDKIMRALKIN